VRIEEVNEEQPVAAANGAKKHLKAITDGSESKKRKKDVMSKNGANESAVKSTVKDADENGSEDEDGFALPGRNKKAVHSLGQSPSKSLTVTRYICLTSSGVKRERSLSWFLQEKKEETFL
jgi:putative intracellular protease/amidase